MFPDSARTETSPRHPAPPRAGVVVPIRAFALGKARLADALDPAERAALARRLAERVLQAAALLHASVLDDPGTLDGAAAAGRDHFRAAGCSRVVVAHADLPYARGLDRLARDGTRPVVALVPCHRDDGTPVLSVPTASEFHFAYGPGSFRRHAAEARRLGLGLRVVRDRDLAFDVDVLVELAADLEATPTP